MKKRIQIVLMSAVVLILTNGCNLLNKPAEEAAPNEVVETGSEVVEDIETIRKNQDLELIKGLILMDGTNMYTAMNLIAGVKGNVNWTISYPEKYKDNPNLFVAEGRAINEERQRDIYLRLLVNRATGAVEFESATKSGKEMQGLHLPTILRSAVENGYY